MQSQLTCLNIGLSPPWLHNCVTTSAIIAVMSSCHNIMCKSTPGSPHFYFHRGEGREERGYFFSSYHNRLKIWHNHCTPPKKLLVLKALDCEPKAPRFTPTSSRFMSLLGHTQFLQKGHLLVPLLLTSNVLLGSPCCLVVSAKPNIS